MATEKNGLFEDVFPIEHGDIPASYVSNVCNVFHDGLESFETLKVENWITHYFSHGF